MIKIKSTREKEKTPVKGITWNIGNGNTRKEKYNEREEKK
jgi:hypothetical protein